MKLTVAICTWNRAEILHQTLRQMERLIVPRDVEWELLVVDNNSTDATERVVAAATARLPIRAFLEPRQGKSHALNLAVANAQGECILWTDDDVLVDERWLQEYVAAFERWPEAAVFGGRIDPWFVGTPPAWLPPVFKRVATAFATLDMGTEPVPLTMELVPFGANMAVRTSAQARFPYDPGLGRRGGSLFGGEEVDVVQRMLRAGLEGRWVPTARVRHLIPAYRQTTAYLRKYYFAQGQIEPAAGTGRESVAQLWGRPRWLWRRAVEAELSYWMHRVTRKPEEWIGDLVEASVLWGRLRGRPPWARR